MTVNQWKNIITAKFLADHDLQEVYGFDPGRPFSEQFSASSIESILFYIVAFVAYTLEMLMGVHVTDVRDMISRERRGSASWYREKALRYQHGRPLVGDTDEYDNASLTDSERTKLEVVRQAAAQEQLDTTGNRVLRVKIAGGQDELIPLSSAIIQGVQSYFNQITYAGVSVLVTSDNPDVLFGAIRVHYNPTVLNSRGYNTATGEKPIETAIAGYLKNLTFNGEYSIMRMIDAIQAVDGVELVHNVEMWALYTGSFRQKIDDRYIPDSGYLAVMGYTHLDDGDPDYEIEPNYLHIFYAPYF